MKSISFIIPVYNSENDIEQCVKHILSLKLTNIEILLIDDGSTDFTPQICDGLADEYPIVKTFHQPNQGASAARNLGINKADSDYLIFVDDDDQILSVNWKKIYSLLEKNIDCICFGMCFSYFWHQKLVREECFRCDIDLLVGKSGIGDYFQALYELNYFTPVWNKIFKKSCLTENDIQFNTQLTNYEDLVFSLQVLTVADKVAVSPEIFYQYNNQYGLDRTVNRIGKMQDLWEKTDIIASAFLSVGNEYGTSQNQLKEKISRNVAGIYYETLRFKLMTASLSESRVVCSELLKDEIFKENSETDGGHNDKVAAWLHKQKFLSIWLDNKYHVFRSFIARWVKLPPYLYRTKRNK